MGLARGPNREWPKNREECLILGLIWAQKEGPINPKDRGKENDKEEE